MFFLHGSAKVRVKVLSSMVIKITTGAYYERQLPEQSGDIINRKVYLGAMVITYATLVVVFVLFVSLCVGGWVFLCGFFLLSFTVITVP